MPFCAAAIDSSRADRLSKAVAALRQRADTILIDQLLQVVPIAAVAARLSGVVMSCR